MPRSRSTPRGGCCSVPTSPPALNILEHLPVDVIGLNCSTGPGVHARACPLPRRIQHQTGRDHPQRRYPDQRQRHWRSFPLEPDSMARQLREMVGEFPGRHRWRLLWHDAGTPCRKSWRSRSRPRRVAAPPCNTAATDRVHDPRGRSAAGASADDRRRAGQHPGVAQGQTPGRWRTTSTAWSTSAVEQMEEGAHALDVCVALTERADERDTDAQARQEAGAQHRSAAGDRLDRSRCHQGRAGAVSGPGDRQLDQHGEWPRAHRVGHAPGPGPRRRGHRADHRRDRHGQDRASASWRSRDRSTTSSPASTASRPKTSSSTRSPSRWRPAIAEFTDSAIETIEGIRRD